MGSVGVACEGADPLGSEQSIREDAILADVLSWCLTAAWLDARRTGDLTGAVSRWARAFRCRATWADHEARCHAIVERAIETCDRRRTCLVLGSGLVRDVPLDRLAEAFERVLLIDVVHLWPARWKARRHADVRLVDLDVTGTTDLLLGRATGIGDPLARLAGDPEIDLTISANCLSQLAILPVDRLERSGAAIRRRFPDLGRRIVEGHLAALARFPGRVCLLSDTEGRDVDAEGRVIERRDLLHGMRLPPADADWDWTLAPIGECADDHAIVHRAHGWVDFHSAATRDKTRTSR